MDVSLELSRTDTGLSYIVATLSDGNDKIVYAETLSMFSKKAINRRKRQGGILTTLRCKGMPPVNVKLTNVGKKVTGVELHATLTVREAVFSGMLTSKTSNPTYASEFFGTLKREFVK